MQLIIMFVCYRLSRRPVCGRPVTVELTSARGVRLHQPVRDTVLSFDWTIVVTWQQWLCANLQKSFTMNSRAERKTHLEIYVHYMWIFLVQKKCVMDYFRRYHSMEKMAKSVLLDYVWSTELVSCDKSNQWKVRIDLNLCIICTDIWLVWCQIQARNLTKTSILTAY